MGWYKRRTKRYYFQSKRVGNRVKKHYVGSGPVAEWEDALSAEMSKGRTKPEAIRAVATGNPELHKSYLLAYNAEHMTSRQAIAKARRRAR